MPHFTCRLIMLALLTLAMSETYGQNLAFRDDFSQGIDHARWQTPTKAWGGDNGGVSPYNVRWQKLPYPQVLLLGQGDSYSGFAYPYATRATRVGAALVSQQAFGPGTLTICAKLPHVLGVVSAFWLYDYHETLGPPTQIWVNEIDWETPTDNHPDGHISYDYARTNSWGGQIPGDEHYYTSRVNLKTANGGTNPSTDGKYHLYSITWGERSTDVTGKITPGYISWGYAKACQDAPHEVKRYIGKTTGTDDVPTRPMALWLGLWFPASDYHGQVGWAGNPEFSETALAIRSVSYIPSPGATRHPLPKGEEILL